MPKYYEFKIAGYYLYFTSYCVIECMHVHASDRKLTEAGSAKFFVKSNGDSVMQNQGVRDFNVSAFFRLELLRKLCYTTLVPACFITSI